MTTEPTTPLGIGLREAREATGLTQAALGDLSGVPQQSISEWETGAVRPSPESLKLLAAALGVAAETLLSLY